ncbi:AP2 domain protein [compost metagenome]
MNQSQCQSIFDYQDGKLFWRFDRGSNAKSGARAGRLLATGYRSIHVSGRRYQEHRLVFLWNHGYMPSQIDHINGEKSDNRIENLREASHSQNQMNTEDRCGESGFRGVRFVPSTGRWSARIYQNGKEIRIGTFDSAQLASDAYHEKAKEMYGEFVR